MCEFFNFLKTNSLKNPVVATVVVVMFLMLAFPMAASAADAAALKATIEAHSGGGLNASVSGNTVTVTGNIANATTVLNLYINADVTVVWRASLSMSTTASAVAIAIEHNAGGNGTFRMESGSITQLGWYSAIYLLAEDGEIIIDGGTISSTSEAINKQVAGNTLTINGGTISSTSGDAIYSIGGTVIINGGTIIGNIHGDRIDNRPPPTGLPDLTSAAMWMYILIALSLALWCYVGCSYVVSRRNRQGG